MKSDLEKKIDEELIRARDLLGIYESIPTGVFGSVMIKNAIVLGETAIKTQQVDDMVIALKDLQELE